MERASSNSSALSASRLRRIGSIFRSSGSTKQHKGSLSVGSDGLSGEGFVQELEATKIPDVQDNTTVSALGYSILQRLQDNVRILQAAASHTNALETTVAEYLKRRQDCMRACKDLVVQASYASTYLENNQGSLVGSQGGRIAPVQGNTTPQIVDNSNSEEYFGNGLSKHPSMNNTCLSCIDELRKFQGSLLENIQSSVTSVYLEYEPSATQNRIDLLFNDGTFRSLAISRMKTAESGFYRSVEFWERYVVRFENYQRLLVDYKDTEGLYTIAKSGGGPLGGIREFDIAPNGDTILEFGNTAPGLKTEGIDDQEDPPSGTRSLTILRFRVSSHMLAEASPYFARILKYSSGGLWFPPLSPPLKQICRDGTEVSVYRMPQNEYNKYNALTTILHAAHMHNGNIPRQVQFDEFVSIAEACLKYECTAPLEMAVEYRWLPQWIHKTTDSSPDGLLLISYVFGLQRLFTRTSKTAILNIYDNQELLKKDLWPDEVRTKISAVIHSKMAQIYAACANALQEYYPIPSEGYSELDGGLRSNPRCLKGSHQCDATNLGWLMLVFNELGILPTVMNLNTDSLTPQRSITELLSCLRRMPTAPQLHAGVCDRASVFRNAINDISNSIVGLTFWDVNGKHGWALSKGHDADHVPRDNTGIEIFELPATVESTQVPVTAKQETVALRIFEHLTTIEDVQSAAMINKTFYTVYKKNEVMFMRNVIKAGKRSLTNGFDAEGKKLLETEQSQTSAASSTSPLSADFSTPSATDLPRPRSMTPVIDVSNDGTFDTTPPLSPIECLSVSASLSSEEVDEIIYPKSGTNQETEHNWDLNSNVKYIQGDLVPVQKALVIEGNKQLRADYERRVGLQVTVPPPTRNYE